MIIDSEVSLRIAMQADREDERLEFKAAKFSFGVDKIIDYCAALANEGGGHIILGISDSKPRQIVGTEAFQNLGDVKSKIFAKLHRRVDIFEIQTASGRVLSFYSPPVPKGHPIAVDGRFLMRVGESLTGMSGDRLRELLTQDTEDLSASVVEGTIESLLDPELVKRFRDLAAARCRRQGDKSSAEKALWIETTSDFELLENLYLTIDGFVTSAAVILLGRERTLARLLPQGELIFEYRSNDSTIDYQERKSSVLFSRLNRTEFPSCGRLKG